MQNNKSSLQEYLFYDLNHQHKSEDYNETETKDSFEDWNDDEDYFSESYAELDSPNNSLDNPILNQSQPYINSNNDEELSNNRNNWARDTE